MAISTSKTTRASIRFPIKTYQQISEYAENNDQSISAAVIKLVEKGLETESSLIKIPHASMTELVDHIDDMFEQSLDEIFEIMETMPRVDYSKLKQAKEKYLNE